MRELRVGRGMNLWDAAVHIRGSASKISRLERAEVPLRAADITDLLAAYEVGDQLTFAIVEDLLDKAGRPFFHDRYADVLPGRHERLTHLEARAHHIRVHDARTVPGPLRTHDYTRALNTLTLPDSRMSPAKPPGRQRPTVLDHTPDCVLVAFLDPVVLDQTIGDAAVMADQIRALRRATQRANTHIRTVPPTDLTQPPSIEYLRFADSRELICLEQADAVVYLRESDHHRAALDRIALAAHDHTDTQRHLTRAEHTHHPRGADRAPTAFGTDGRSLAESTGATPAPTTTPRPAREHSS
nr:Scr1 family TA system antitoxin-like transcriptional regulator [Streptomyces sp. SID3343]